MKMTGLCWTDKLDEKKVESILPEMSAASQHAITFPRLSSPRGPRLARSWNWISCGDIHIHTVRDIKVLEEEFRAHGSVLRSEREWRADVVLLWRAAMQSILTYRYIYVCVCEEFFHQPVWPFSALIVYNLYLCFDPFYTPSDCWKRLKCILNTYSCKCFTSTVYIWNSVHFILVINRHLVSFLMLEPC